MHVQSRSNSDSNISAVAPIATIRAYRRTGGAIVTVDCPGRPLHRYKVSLRRYHALREWAGSDRHPWHGSGAWLRNSMTACLWAKEVTAQTSA